MKTLLYTTEIIFFCAFIATAAEVPNARITLNVNTQENEPVPGAKVGIGGGLNTIDGEFPRRVNGATAPDGSFTATVGSSLGIVSAFAEASNYYSTELRGLKLYKTDEEMLLAQQQGRWMPWEQSITLVLKPIKNPVPMYAKKIDTAMPEFGKPAGYDLEKGDWVAPYGKGVRSDLEFTVEGTYESQRNYSGTLTLRLPGEENGIQAHEINPLQRSELKMPYSAPEAEYAKSWIWRNARETKPEPHARSGFVNDSNGLRGFIFRVRSVVNERNELVSANYGKIHGPVYFRLFEKGQSRIGFTYYYNPDQTRNLEFDPKRNLFPGEHVIEP